ncbi:MAG: caspase family protein [Chloroflexi bacterium]|nr:caspase family protein [Chloroflexota bacterium]
MAFDKGFALVIGIGSYLHINGANIPISVSDAQEVGRILCDQNLCGYPSAQVTILHDHTASRQNILSALDKLAGKTSAENTVTLFYCGHGATGTDGNYYLTTVDSQVQGDRVVAGTGISEVDLLDKLRAIPAQRLILLFNSCHSGELSPDLTLGDQETSFGDASLPVSAAEALLSAGEGRIIIAASRAAQKSWIGGGKLSIFTQALVDGLSGKGYVPNNNGYISAFGLYEHIYTAVKETAGKLGKTQEPELTVLKGVGPFPVSLYRGATTLGTFDSQESLPEGSAVREVDQKHSARLFQTKTKIVTASGERAVAVGGNVTGSTIITGNQNTIQQSTGRNTAQTAGGGRATVTDRSRRTVFDQRGQQVQYQYNAANDINFGAAQNRADALAELRKLQAELGKAKEAGAIEEDAATDAAYQVTKAVQQAQKPDADRQTILGHLEQAKDVIVKVAANVTAAGGLITAVSQAIQMVQRLFS